MMTEKSSAGLYSLFGFLGAAFTYGIMTNDFSPFKEITFMGGINGAEAFEESSVKELENMWFEDPKMTFTLKRPDSHPERRRLHMGGNNHILNR